MAVCEVVAFVFVFANVLEPSELESDKNAPSRESNMRPSTLWWR
jgi:hypothetical protein